MSKHPSSSNSRTRLLEAASKLFYQQGYNATGINQVISDASVAKASFYHYFSSKEELCVAYLQRRHQDWFCWLREEVEAQTKPQDKVLSLFSFLEKWLRASDFRGCAFLNIASEFPSPDNQIRQIVVDHKMALRDYIEQLVGQLDTLKATSTHRSLANSIYILFSGAIVESQIYRETWSIEAARETVKKMIT